MTTPFNDIDVGDPPVLLQQRRGVGWIGLLAGLIMIAGVSGLLWVNYDRLIEASSTKTASGNAAATADTEPGPSLADFQALQQQTTQAWQSTSQSVESQNAELKRLSDQIAALTARIEQLQQPPVSAPPPQAVDALRPNATVTPRASIATTSPAATAPAAPRKQPARRPAAPKPAGTISLGGAPLPGTTPAPIR